MKNLILIVLLCVSLPVIAENIEVKEVLGVGATKNEAITDALLDAVQQVKGVEVKTSRDLKVELSSIVNKDGTAITSVTESIETQPFNRAFGWVKTYEIVDIKRPSEKMKQWEVKLKVSVPVYQSLIVDDKRKSLVVLPFRTPAQSVKLSDSRYSPRTLSTQIAEATNTLFVQSNRYAVLNRAFEQQMEDERTLWASTEVSSKEASRLGQKLGADLVLLGSIFRFDIVDEVKEFYGSRSPIKHVDVEVNYKIIEAATEKILWSNKFQHQEDIKVNKFEKRERNYTAEILDIVSQNLSQDVLSHFFPLRILEKHGTNLILNQGEQNIEVGEDYFVYSVGSSIADPNTGMTIDVRGYRQGIIEIVQVNSKYSLAKLIEGDITTMGPTSLITPVTTATKRSEDNNVPGQLTPGSSEKPFKW